MTEPSLSSDVKSMLHDEHSKRLEALEKKTNGLIQTRADHGHQFIVIIDRVKAFEERVAAIEQMADILNLKESIFKRVTVLEEQLMSLDDDVAVLWSKNDEVEPREPLPPEDLD